MTIGWRHSKCRYRPNRNFVGRDGLLERIHKSLCGSPARPEPVSCLLQGLAGIGKTQVALEYCYRHAGDYDWQFWIAAGDNTQLSDAFGNIGEEMPPTARESDDVVSDVLRWLETTDDSWIIVFDNVEDWSLLYDTYSPRRCLGRSVILLTSQITVFSSEVDHVFPMESLPISEGAQVLGRQVYGAAALSPGECEAALQISRKFSGFPLALVHIGGFIKESASSIAKYGEVFGARYPAGWKGRTHATSQYDKPIDRVWTFALSDGQLSADARRLVQMLSFLDPDQIPESILLKSFAEDPASWGTEAGSEAAEFWGLRQSLRKRSLVSIRRAATSTTGDIFTMQRSLQHAILLQLDQDPALRSAIFHKALKTIRLATPSPSVKQIPNPKLWPQFETVTPHIISLCHKFVQSVPPMQGTLEFARLLYDGGFSLWERQDSATAEDAVLVLSTALKTLNEISYPTNTRLRADVLAVMGMCCDRLGPSIFQQALDMRKEARCIRQAIKEQEVRDDDVSPTTDRLLYNSLNDQGIAEMQLNRFHEAERLFAECLRTYQTWGSEADIPFEYAKYYHNMGLVRMCQGRFTEAVAFLRKAVELEELYEGADSSPLISLFSYDFACVLFQAGDVKSALARHMKVLREREIHAGRGSEMALLSCYTVGAMYHHVEDLEQAEYYMKECIDRANNAECKGWPEYARGRTYMHLAKVMRARLAKDEDVKPIEEIGQVILAKYRDFAQSFTPITDDDMILYDALQPVLHGRYTGRGLVPLLHTIAIGWSEGIYTTGY